MKYRLGIDLGTSSIGIAAYELDDNKEIKKLIYLDNYIFGEPILPKTLETSNTARRSARLVRRQIERKAKRFKKLSYLAASLGIKKEDLDSIPPDKIHGLRSKAVSEQISLPELMKVFSHIVKNRGYKGDLSNEDKGVGDKISQTESMFKDLGVKTLGQLLLDKKVEAQKDKVAWRKLNEGGTFIKREDIINEFNFIWQEQQKYYPQLRGDYDITYKKMFLDHLGASKISLRDAFYSAIFYQRPIKWLLETIGNCELEPSKKRAAEAQPAYQDYRIASIVSNLRIKNTVTKKEYPLTHEQIKTICDYISSNFDKYNEEDKIPFSSIYEVLNLKECEYFTSEGSVTLSKGIKGNTTLKAFYNAGFLNEWENLTDKVQEIVIEFLSNITKYSDIQENPEDSIDSFVRDLSINCVGANDEDFKNAASFIKELRAKNIFKKSSFKLQQGRASYCLDVLKKITEELKKGQNEANIIKVLYPKNKNNVRTELRDISEVEIGNPVIDRTLKEFKRTLDFVIHKLNSNPQEITIELSRDLKNPLSKRRYFEEQNNITAKGRLEAAKELEKNNIVCTSKNIDKYLLWREQEHKCPYCGQDIALNMLAEENQTNIDHIIPQAKSGPNIFSNKVLCHTQCNINKGDKVPYEINKFNKDIDDYKEFLKKLKNEKSKRDDKKEYKEFGSHSPLINLVQNLFKQFSKEKKGYFNQRKHKYTPTDRGRVILDKINNLLIKPDDIEKKFSERQNQQTAWITKIVLDWCKDICPDVIPSFGQLTAYLRQAWQFDRILPRIRNEEGKPLFTEDKNEIRGDIWEELFDTKSLKFKDAKALKEGFKNYLSSLKTPPLTDKDKQKEFQSFCINQRFANKFYKRCDHRHHAVDAAVIGLCTLSLIQQAEAHNSRYGTLHEICDKNGETLVKGFLAESNDIPVYSEARDAVQQYLKNYVVWHKPDYFPSGKLFDEMAYGIKKDKDGKERFTIRQTLEKFIYKIKKQDELIKKVNTMVVGDAIKKEIIKQFKERMESGMALKDAFVGKDNKDGITYRGNKLKKMKVMYKEKSLIEYKKEIDMALITPDANGNPRNKYYQNAGFACIDFDAQTGKRKCLIPLWKYIKEKDKPLENNTVRIFAGDIIFDEKDNNFYKVRSFMERDGMSLQNATETQGGIVTKSSMKGLCKVVNRAELAKIKKAYGK